MLLLVCLFDSVLAADPGAPPTFVLNSDDFSALTAVLADLSVELSVDVANECPAYPNDDISAVPWARVAIACNNEGRLVSLTIEVQNTETAAASVASVTLTFPRQIALLTAVRDLRIRRFPLDTETPDVFGALAALQYLHLDYNGLRGELPASIGTLATLRDLNVVGNGFSGALNQDFLAAATEMQACSLFDSAKPQASAESLPDKRRRESCFQCPLPRIAHAKCVTTWRTDPCLTEVDGCAPLDERTPKTTHEQQHTMYLSLSITAFVLALIGVGVAAFAVFNARRATLRAAAARREALVAATAAASQAAAASESRRTSRSSTTTGDNVVNAGGGGGGGDGVDGDDAARRSRAGSRGLRSRSSSSALSSERSGRRLEKRASSRRKAKGGGAAGGADVSMQMLGASAPLTLASSLNRAETGLLQGPAASDAASSASASAMASPPVSGDLPRVTAAAAATDDDDNNEPATMNPLVDRNSQYDRVASAVLKTERRRSRKSSGDAPYAQIVLRDETLRSSATSTGPYGNIPGRAAETEVERARPVSTHQYDDAASAFRTTGTRTMRRKNRSPVPSPRKEKG